MVSNIITDLNRKLNLELELQELISDKNNKVYRLYCNKKNYALKVYGNHNGKKEGAVLDIYSQKGVNVPHCYFVSNEFTLMDYIDGRLLSNLINDEFGDTTWIKPLVDAISYIHDKTALVPDFVIGPADFDPANILFGDKAVYIVDWEEVCVEKAEEQLGRLFGNILGSDPVLSSYKLSIVREILRLYQETVDGVLDMDLVEIAIFDILTHIAAHDDDKREKLTEFIKHRYTMRIFE